MKNAYTGDELSEQIWFPFQVVNLGSIPGKGLAVNGTTIMAWEIQPESTKDAEVWFKDGIKRMEIWEMRDGWSIEGWRTDMDSYPAFVDEHELERDEVLELLHKHLLNE